MSSRWFFVLPSTLRRIVRSARESLQPLMVTMKERMKKKETNDTHTFVYMQRQRVSLLTDIFMSKSKLT